MNSLKKEKTIENDVLVEIIDDNNRPLAVMHREAAHRQLLKHRSVHVLIFNPDKKLYLQKRNKNNPLFPNRWDVSARTHPLVGESSLDAALRVLREELQLDTEHPQFIRSLPACSETGFEHVTMFTVTKVAHPIVPNPDKVSEGYFFSPEELTCLVKEFRELLTPTLVTLWESGMLTA